MELLSKFLEESMKKMGLNQAHEAGIVQIDWKEYVGEEASQNSRPVALRKSTLIVQTTSPAWSYHLSMKKSELIQKAAEKKRAFDDIRFEAGLLPMNDPDTGKSIDGLEP